jgi:hypothetical protein
VKKARSDKNELDLTPNTRKKVMEKSGKNALKRIRQKLLMKGQDEVVPKGLRNTYEGVLHFCRTNTRDKRRADLGDAFDENSAYVLDGYVIALRARVLMRRAAHLASPTPCSRMHRCACPPFHPFARRPASGMLLTPPKIQCST